MVGTCDRCRVATAKAIVMFPSGGLLEFCNHHLEYWFNDKNDPGVDYEIFYHPEHESEKEDA